VVDDRDDNLSVDHRRAHLDRIGRGRVAERVLDQVDENPLELRRVDQHGRALVGKLGERRSRGSESISLAVPIAVSGERRSWLTERSTAVFVASLRLSCSRSIAVASSAESTAVTRARSAASGAREDSKNREPTWRSPASSTRTCSSGSGERGGPSSIQQCVTPSRSAVNTAIAGSSLSAEDRPRRSAATSAA
jgi:hypothetical protein